MAELAYATVLETVVFGHVGSTPTWAIMDKHWFTRFYQKDIDQKYLNNMCKATMFFMNWFTCSDTSYKDMLVKMHEIATDGYQGYTNSNYLLVVSNGFRGDRTTTWYPILKKKWFSGIGDKPIIRPEVKGFPKWMSHWLENTDEGYVLHLPDSGFVQNYLHKLAQVMERLKSGITLAMLARYIQLFVIAHPFEKVNYSILMAQVSALLVKKGCKPMYHGYLDFECFVYDYDKIEKTFIDMVGKADRS